MFLNSFYDVHFNIEGIVFAVLGVMVTSLYQIVSVVCINVCETYTDTVRAVGRS